MPARRDRALVCSKRMNISVGIKLALVLAAAVLLAGCAHQRPVLYPEDDGAAGGQVQAQRVIDQCMAKAEANGLDYSDGDIAKRTARGAVVGGASGAAVGAIYGNAGRGAAAGAARAAIWGFFAGLFSRGKPAPVYRHFVNHCLRERGYQPIGWQ